MKKELTQEKLKEILEYDENTGQFTWKVSRGGILKGSVAGRLNDSGYLLVTIFKKAYRIHRLVWLYVYGYFPKECIDHINGIRNDNRLCNLREATFLENAHNQKLKSKNTSGVKGIHWNNERGKWEAQIRFNWKRFFLGRFNTIEEAEQAVKSKREEFHKEFANHG